MVRAGAGSERAPPPPASLLRQAGPAALLLRAGEHAMPAGRSLLLLDLAAQLGAPRNVAAATYEAWRRASKQRAHAPAPTG
jgi:hypothetical protein